MVISGSNMRRRGLGDMQLWQRDDRLNNQKYRTRKHKKIMKIKYSDKSRQKPGWFPIWKQRLTGRAAMIVALTTGLLMAGVSARADIGNQLVNPGWENGNTGWSSQGNAPTWVTGNANAYYYNYGGNGGGPCGAPAGSFPIVMHGGIECAQSWGGGNGQVSYWQQTVATLAGSTWSASGYGYTSTYDVAVNGGFDVDVAFLDVSNNVLAEYQSSAVTNVQCGGPSIDAWLYLPVTNQVQNGVIIGTVPAGVLTAPAGTVAVRYQDQWITGANAGGSVFWDDADLDLISGPVAPVITNLAPSYIYFVTNQQLTFTALGGNGANITNVQIVATTTGLPGTGSGSITVTNGPGSPALTLVGLGTPNVDVSLALNTNTLYSVTVEVIDNNGIVVQQQDQFDTVSPVLEWEAEDFNFSGGEWITNITANGGLYAYTNQVGETSIDEQFANSATHGGGAYRPSDPVNFQVLGEATSSGISYTQQKYAQYLAANPGSGNNQQTEPACVGWLSVNDWLNYTRNFPAGHYNVYARIATGASGPQCSLQQVTSDPTQPNQTVTNLGTFSLNGSGWNVDGYSALLDNFGNLVSVSLGGTNTLRVQVVQGGNPNLDSFLIVPAFTIPTPILESSYPNSVQPFEPTNKFVFTVGQSGGSPITAGGVHLILNGTDVTSQVSFTSTATTWTGAIAIATNDVYAAVINVTNSTHLSSSFVINFDTFTQNNYMWEAEDFDFNGGSFIDDPQPTGDFTVGASGYSSGTLQTNSYWGYPGGDPDNQAINGIDFSNPGSGQPVQYRPADNFGTQVASDFLRAKFTNSAALLNDPNIGDFNIGYFNPGMWANYTHNYPQGNYYVYGRIACGNGAYTNALLSLVTGGWGTPNQTTSLLGTFTDTNPPVGWQTYEWVPLQDANGNLVAVPFNGSTNTIRLGCATSGSINVNFLMLVPAPASALPPQFTIAKSGSQVNISFPTQIGHTYYVLSTTSLSFPVTWSTNSTVGGTGSVQTVPDTIGGGAKFYRLQIQ